MEKIRTVYFKALDNKFKLEMFDLNKTGDCGSPRGSQATESRGARMNWRYVTALCIVLGWVLFGIVRLMGGGK
jgi:hypothetical protein